MQPPFFASVLRLPSSGVDPDRSAGVSSPSRVTGLRSAFIVAAAAVSAPAAAEAAAARVTSANGTMATATAAMRTQKRRIRRSPGVFATGAHERASRLVRLPESYMSYCTKMAATS